MATNKRKDAAALFELIDKSTLKVPKSSGGGSLQIPSWWASKGNPPREEGAAETASGAGGRTAGAGAAKQDARGAGGIPQTRIFEPPPANVAPITTPSIRPPSASAPAPVSSPVKLRTGASAGAAPARPIAQTAQTTEEEPAERSGSTVSGNGPETGTEKPRWRPQPGAFARLPSWVLLTGAAAVLVIVCGVVLLAKRGNTVIAQNSLEGRGNLVPPVRSGLLPPPMTGTGSGSPISAGNTRVTPSGPAAAPVTAGSAEGRVFQPGIVARAPENYYVIICSTPSATIADRNAKLVAKGGIDVSIERTPGPRKDLWYTLVMVKGFASTSAAQPFRDQIVRIGDQLERNAWKDAYIRNGISQPAGSQTR